MKDKIKQAKGSYGKFIDSDFRLGQAEAVEFCYRSEKKVIVIIASTGAGKSLLGMTLGAMYDKFLYLVGSKQLQDQLFLDFPEAQMMKGRGNYPCAAMPGYTAEDCYNTEETPCPYTYKCAYKLQKQRTLNSSKQILNYNYFVTESNFVGQFTDYPLIVADEADSLEDLLSDTVSLDFSVYMMKRLGIPLPKYKSFTAIHAIEEWESWCDTCTEILKQKHNELGMDLDEAVQGSQEHVKLVREMQRVNGMIGKVRIFKQYMNDTWIVNIIKKGNEVVSWNMKPTWLNGELTEKYFFRHGGKIVMMSATFPNKEVLAELLGLGVGDIDLIEIPSTFPVENRQVYLMYSADMKSMKGGMGIDADEIRKIQDAIECILSKHPNEKGIIHTVNWKLNKAVMDIKSNRLITHESGNKVEVLDQFIRSKKPLVLVSPSSTRGVDLYDDRSRFTIIAKAPFKSLGDKLVASRVYSKNGIGQYWYSSVAAQEIVQACGRSVRSKEDYAVTYILDSQACDLIVNHRRLFPKYFMDAVEMG